MRNHAPLGWAGLALSLALLGGAPTAHAQNRADGGGWLGIYSQSLTPELREGLDYRGEGVLVNRVVENSPAERAGIEKGDVIVSVDQRAVESPDELASIVRSQGAGETVSIRIVRDGERRTLEARLSGRPGSDEGDVLGNGDVQKFKFKVDGDRKELEDLNDIPEVPGVPVREEIRRMIREGKAKEFRIEGTPGRAKLGVRAEDAGDNGSGQGAQVVEVMENTPAERAGIRVGDVITRVEGQSINDVTDLIQTLRGKSGRVEIELRRRGSRRTVEAEIEDITPTTPIAPRAPHTMRRINPNPHVFEWRGDSGDGLLDDGKNTAELKRELSDLRRELAELRKELEEIKRER